jgi:hypothetical protein
MVESYRDSLSRNAYGIIEEISVSHDPADFDTRRNRTGKLYGRFAASRQKQHARS